MNNLYIFNGSSLSATCVSALFVVLLQTIVLEACDDDKPAAPNLIPEDVKGTDASVASSNFAGVLGTDASVASSDASKPPDADASTGPITPSQAAAYRQEVLDAYDRYLHVSCECWVVNDLYESTDQCYSVMGFSLDMVECATQAMADLDSPELRALIDCLLETLESLFECYDASECDLQAIGLCPIPEQCFATMQMDSIVKVIEKCPELGLLTGVSP